MKFSKKKKKKKEHTNNHNKPISKLELRKS